MDSIGILIHDNIGTDNKAEIRMEETGQHIRMQPIDAREAIETRRGKVVPVLGRTPRPALLKVEPELTQDQIMASSKTPQTNPDPKITSHPAMRPQSSRAVSHKDG